MSLKRPEGEQEALQEFLRSDVWRLVKARLAEHVQADAKVLIYGTSLSIEEVRVVQGRIAAYRALIEEPDATLDTRIREGEQPDGVGRRRAGRP